MHMGILCELAWYFYIYFSLAYLHKYATRDILWYCSAFTKHAGRVVLTTYHWYGVREDLRVGLSQKLGLPVPSSSVQKQTLNIHTYGLYSGKLHVYYG